MREYSCCFTGHRKIPESEYYKVMFLLRQTIEQKIKEGYKVFCAGGALGFDTMAAMTVLKLREQYPHIQLHLYLPCMDQAQKWSEQAKARYEEIKQQSNLIVYVSQYYTSDCMLKRNRALIDKSSLCIAYCNQSKGGTVYTVNYAKDQDVEVINLARNISMGAF